MCYAIYLHLFALGNVNIKENPSSDTFAIASKKRDIFDYVWIILTDCFFVYFKNKNVEFCGYLILTSKSYLQKQKKNNNYLNYFVHLIDKKCHLI